jgi:hypothetical protein
MSLLHNILGNATETSSIHEEVQNSLIENESVIKSYKLIRDEIIFTTQRLILIDKQGISGKKMGVVSIPYKAITRFSKECAGTFDLDEELKIWIGSHSLPVSYRFKKGTNLDEVYKILSQAVL